MAGQRIARVRPSRQRLLVIVVALVGVGCVADPRASEEGPGSTPTASAASSASAPSVASPLSTSSASPPPSGAPAPGSSAAVAALRAELVAELRGSDCISSVIPEWLAPPVGVLDALAAELNGPSGLLGDGISYVGSFEEALAAWSLLPLEAGDYDPGFDSDAFGIGGIQPDRVIVNGPPAGTVWVGEFRPFELADGRAGWTFTSGMLYAAEDCEA